jgi:hypothetical protein
MSAYPSNLTIVENPMPDIPLLDRDSILNLREIRDKGEYFYLSFIIFLYRTLC